MQVKSMIRSSHVKNMFVCHVVRVDTEEDLSGELDGGNIEDCHRVAIEWVDNYNNDSSNETKINLTDGVSNVLDLQE